MRDCASASSKRVIVQIVFYLCRKWFLIMLFLSRRGHLFSIQIFICLLYYGECCNFGPGNLGLFNFGTGNVGFLNFGVGNAGIGNKGFLNAGALNTGFSQLGVRNIGALNFASLPNSVSVFNVPVAPNLSPPLPAIGSGRRRRRRSTMNYQEGKFPWLSGSRTRTTKGE